MTVRTRFAPSPTGYLHIGGVRTALFCWLFARRHGGQFILRIDDTDQQRNVEEALAPILHGLKWLGVDWDEGPDIGGPYAPYYQSQRGARYQEAVDQLLAAGAAYRDFATTEELDAERKAAQAEKRPFIYSRRWMAETPEHAAAFAAEGRQAVVRLKMPRDGKLVLHDLIRGDVEFEWAREQDHVIQRADGTCLYHLANVVDDYDFKISHVIRAEEHLSNTARQVFIIQALGYPLPEYAHLPFVAEPGSHNKLTKRRLKEYLKISEFAQLMNHGQAIADRIKLATSAETFNPVIVDFYEQVGYVPDAIINYLALLGWAYDDRREFFTRQELTEIFTLDKVTKAPASFDTKKLWHFQDHYMAELPIKQKVAMMVPFLQKAGLVSSPPSCELAPKLTRIVEAAGDRLKVAGDIIAYADFFFLADDAYPYDAKALEKRVRKEGAAGRLAEFRDVVSKIPDDSFDTATLERALHDYVASSGIAIGDIIHAVRVAVTGQAVGPGLFDCLDILGKPSVLARIDRTLETVR